MINKTEDTFYDIFNNYYVKLIENLKKTRINYLKAKKDRYCSDEFDFFSKWIENLISKDDDSYLKIINDSAGEKKINKKTIRYLNEEDILDQNIFKYDSLAWCYFKFTKEFLDSFNNYSQREEILKITIKILIGNLNDSRLVKFNSIKLMSLFSYNIIKNENFYFSIYFERLIDKEDNNCLEIIRFFGIHDNESNFLSDIFNKFEDEFLNDNIKYPIIEYDRIGIVEEFNKNLYDIMIYEKKEVEYKNKKIKLCFPFSQISSKNIIETKKIEINIGSSREKVYIEKENYEMNNFQITEDKERVFERISHSKTNEEIITKIVMDENIKHNLSVQEKFLINIKNNIIISGRSGTGKTTIIVYKIFFTILNYITTKYKSDYNEIKLNDVIYYTNNDKDKLKVVFTTFSNTLCIKVEEYYMELHNAFTKMRNINQEYTMTNSNIDKKNSFREIYNYPLFVNFRKILFLIDGSINGQFFFRENRNKLSKSEKDSDIYYIKDCEYKLNDYISLDLFEYDRRNYLYRTQKIKGTIKKIEINEEVFIKDFVLKVLSTDIIKVINSTNLNLSFIYSQIFSIIKGSIYSHLSYMNCISLDDYLKVGSKFVEIDENQRKIVYKVFEEYELWKFNNKFFDIQDLVNHLIRQVKLELKGIKLIDYLFIDEVQDLAINQIYLLSLITRYPIVYAGDTCQTISKSIRFRFSELEQIFHGFSLIIENYKKPLHAPLNENYRFGYNILKMSNFISNIIYELFPNTIDRNNTEFSQNKSNFNPVILNELGSLFEMMEINFKKDFDFFAFASFHCVICRTKSISESLNEKYKKLKTTFISDSKGLEYECVVIYNFFQDSNFKKVWKDILNKIKVKEIENEFLDKIIKTLMLSTNNEEENNKIIDNFKKIFYPTIEEKNLFNSENYFEFCTELKELYVAITRARTFLIFYDEDEEVFSIFKKLLEPTKILKLCSDDKILFDISSYLKENNVKVEEKELEREGDKYFEIKKYTLAMYCYQFTNEKKLELSKAYQIYEKICEMNEKEDKKWIEQNEKVIEILNLIDSENEIIGNCLLNINKREEALLFYEKSKNFRKCGKICTQLLQNYERAGKYYDLASEYSLAIESYLSGKLYERLFEYIVRIYKELDIFNIIEIYKKYSYNYLISNFIKIKPIVFKYKINYYKTETKKIFPNFEFITYERHASKCLDPLLYFNNEIDNCVDIKHSLNEKFYKNDILLNVTDLPILKKDNLLIYFLNSEMILDENERNEEMNLDIDRSVNSQKMKNMYEFITNYIEIIVNRKVNFHIFNEYKDFLDYDLIEKLKKRIEDIKFYPHHANYIISAITQFDNCDILKLLYSIYVNQNIDLAYKEIFLNLKPNDYKRKITGSAESLFNENKYKIKYRIENFKAVNFIQTNKDNCCAFSEQIIYQIMRILKNQNFSEDDTKELLTKLFFMNGYFENLILLVKFPLNAYLSASISNYNLFSKIINNRSFHYYNEEIDFTYLLNSFIRINLERFLTCLNKFRLVNEIYKNKEDNLSQQIEFVKNNLKIYPKLHQLICEICFQLDKSLFKTIDTTNYASILIYMRTFRNFLEDPIKYLLSKNQIYDLLEIGSTLSLFLYIYGGRNFKYNKEMSQFKKNDYEISITCFELINEVKNILIGLSIFQYKLLEIKSKNYLSIAKNILFSIFNIFNVSILPNHSLYNKVYNNFPFVVINTNSIIFIETETFGNTCYSILKDEDTKNFDSKGENYLINPKFLWNPIYFFIKNFSYSLISKCFDNITCPKFPIGDQDALFNLNEMVRFYSIFYNFWYIQSFYNEYEYNKELDKSIEIKKVQINKKLKFVDFTLLNKRYLYDNNYFNYNHMKSFIDQMSGTSYEITRFNIELFIYFWNLPIIRNPYLNYRSCEFLYFLFQNFRKIKEIKCDDLIEKIRKLENSIQMTYSEYNENRNVKEFGNEKYLKEQLNNKEYLEYNINLNLFEFYLSYFNLCSYYDEVLYINCRFIEKNEKCYKELLLLNQLLVGKDYFNFNINLIEVIKKYINDIPLFLIINWIGKVLSFIIFIINALYSITHKELNIKFYKEVVTNEEVLLVNIYFNKFKEYKKDSSYENRLYNCVTDYFLILEKFIMTMKYQDIPSFLNELYEINLYSICKSLNIVNKENKNNIFYREIEDLYKKFIKTSKYYKENMEYYKINGINDNNNVFFKLSFDDININRKFVLNYIDFKEKIEILSEIKEEKESLYKNLLIKDVVKNVDFKPFRIFNSDHLVNSCKSPSRVLEYLRNEITDQNEIFEIISEIYN